MDIGGQQAEQNYMKKRKPRSGKARSGRTMTSSGSNVRNGRAAVKHTALETYCNPLKPPEQALDLPT